MALHYFINRQKQLEKSKIDYIYPIKNYRDMKTFKNYMLLTLVLSLFLTSCQTKKQTPKVKEAQTVVTKIQELNPKISAIDLAFKTEITNVYQAYNKLKDALVASDPTLALAAANEVLANLNKVDMGLLKKSESHKVWMTEKPLLVAELNMFIKGNSLEEQRASFLKISNSMITLVENFGTSEKVMVQFCPMADDFNGGYWLSADTAIKNPYFGDKMLKCGSTKRIIN